MSQPSVPTLASQPAAPADTSTKAGHARITFAQVRPGVYNITTQQGVRRVDEWSCSYDNAEVAWAEYLRAKAAFEAFGTDTALAAEYDRLTTAIHGCEQRRKPTGQLNDRRDAIQPLRGADRIRRERERWQASIPLMRSLQGLPYDQWRDAVEAARDSFDATHPDL